MAGSERDNVNLPHAVLSIHKKTSMNRNYNMFSTELQRQKQNSVHSINALEIESCDASPKSDEVRVTPRFQLETENN